MRGVGSYFKFSTGRSTSVYAPFWGILLCTPLYIFIQVKFLSSICENEYDGNSLSGSFKSQTITCRLVVFIVLKSYLLGALCRVQFQCSVLTSRMLKIRSFSWKRARGHSRVKTLGMTVGKSEKNKFTLKNTYHGPRGFLLREKNTITTKDKLKKRIKESLWDQSTPYKKTCKGQKCFDLKR